MSNPTHKDAAGAGAGAAVAWPDPQREVAFRRWLDRIGPAFGLAPGTVRLASADASFRRYLRIDSAQGSRIIMDAPPEREDSEPFVKVAALLAQAGLNVPAVLDWHPESGFLLLQDLGAQTMLEAIDADVPAANQGLYLKAVDALIALQLASRPGVLPPYDQALLARELALFPDWYLERHRGIVVQGSLRETLDRTFGLIVQRNLASPSVYVHRDFMPRNLMMPVGAAETRLGDTAETRLGEVVETRLGETVETRLGVLDFQDAVYGPITYDIASLMRDAFLSWDEEFVLDITVRYWQRAQQAGLPVDSDFGEFYRGVEWMGLQRHLKVAGIFARLTLRDGKPRYLADTPRFIAYIRATASRYRELTPLLALIDQAEGTQQTTAYMFGRA